MAKNSTITKEKTISARKKAKKLKTKETIIIVVIALILALIDAALVVAVIKYNDAHDNGEHTEKPKEFEYNKYLVGSAATTEGEYYDTSKTGAGVDVDMEKVKKEIDAYDYDDFLLSSTPTDFVVVRVENYGDIVVALREDIAPLTVNNFKALVAKHFYDNTTIHRVVKDFMIQGGGTSKTGDKKTTSAIVGEFTQNGHKNNLLHVKGVISMARTSEKNSATSEFFIMHDDSSSLDGKYASFGYVLAGLDVVDAIAKCEVKASSITGEKSTPTTQIVIKDVFFVEPKKNTGIASDKKVTEKVDSYKISAVDDNGDPIQGVSFKLINALTSEQAVYAITNEKGEAEFDAKVAGYYIEIVSANGYSYEDSYELPEGTTGLTLNLKKATKEE